MPLGMILADWDSQLGPKIKAVAPKGFEISKPEINKILMSHSISEKTEPEIVDLRLKDKIILSYSCKDKIATLGYGMLLLILDENERNEIDGLKQKLFQIGQEIFENHGIKKIELFRGFSHEIFAKKATRKIIFIGPSNVGKSSIKKLFFEGVSSEVLLNSPLEPTYGLEHVNYEWLDLDLGIADLAGQEIDRFLDDSRVSDLDPFQGVDLVLFIFDPVYWQEDSKKIVYQYKQIEKMLEKEHIQANLHTICHKIDLIPKNERTAFKNEIKYALPLGSDNFIFFTSIQTNLLFSLIRAMQSVLGTISKRTEDIEEILYETISNKKQIAVFLLEKNKILLEITTKDFPFLNFELFRQYFHSTETFLNTFQENNRSYTLASPNLKILSRNFGNKPTERIILLSPQYSIDYLEQMYESIQYSIMYLDTEFFEEETSLDKSGNEC